MTPDEYQKTQSKMSTHSEQTVLALAASGISGYSMASTLGIYLASVNDAATRLADLFQSSLLRVRPLGMSTPDGEGDRLTEAVVKILEDDRTNPLPRLGRIARSEPSTIARRVSAQVFKANDIERLRWVNDPQPCPLCIGLQGTYPVNELPDSHPRCECITLPVRNPRRKAT